MNQAILKAGSIISDTGNSSQSGSGKSIWTISVCRGASANLRGQSSGKSWSVGMSTSSGKSGKLHLSWSSDKVWSFSKCNVNRYKF